MSGLLFLAVIALLIYLLTQNFSRNPQGGFELRAYEEGRYLVALLAKIAKSDGHVNELEAELISQTLDDIAVKLGGDAIRRAELKLIYRREKENLANAYEIAREYQERFRLNADAAVAKMAFLLNLAYIDGDLSADERKVITQIALGLRLDGSMLNALFLRFDAFYAQRRSERFTKWQEERNEQAQSGSWSYNGRWSGKFSGAGSDSNLGQRGQNLSPYAVLGLTENAPFEQVKKKYRELVRQYHPDILMGRGESEEMIEKSTRKLQEINEAYETIKQRAA